MSNDLVLTHPVVKAILIVEACVAERVRPRTLDLEVTVEALPVVLFPLKGNFTPLCLSSLRCINGYRRHTDECNDGLASRPWGVAIYS